MSTAAVVKRASRLGIKPTKKGNSNFFTPEEAKRIVAGKTENQPDKPKYHKLSLSELKALHPLVTDERCFDTKWFPDIEF